MSDTVTKIEPALTPEGWARLTTDGTVVLGDDKKVYLGLSGDPHTIEFENMDPAGFDVALAEMPALIAVANAALPHGDLRKITRTWVNWLREEADVLKRNGAGAGALMAAEIADALASYLPPK